MKSENHSAIFFLVFILITQTTSIGPSDEEFQSIVQISNKIEDSESIKLNSANYRHFLSNISDPWMIFFYESLVYKSLLAHIHWKNFTQEKKFQDWKLKLGTIDLVFEKIVPKKLKIPVVPCYLYITDKFIYYYTGTGKSEDLKRIINEKLFLQYDRRNFYLDEPDAGFLLKFKKKLVEDPAVWIFGIFLLSFFLLCTLTVSFKNLTTKKLKTD